MFLKILIIAACIAFAIYMLRAKRSPAPVTWRPAPPQRLTLLSVAALMLFVLSLFCALLWMTGITDTVTVTGEVQSGTGLLRVAAVLMMLSVGCTLIAFFKRARP